MVLGNDERSDVVGDDPQPARLVNGEATADPQQEQRVASKTGPGKHKAVFVNAAEMKAEMKKNMFKPKYDVHDLYFTEGKAQEIARSHLFESITLAVISLNALWLAIDGDNNDAQILNDYEPIFMIMELFFCCYFTFEWTARFLSFRRKLQAFTDGWFAFDSILVAMMVMETWVMPLIFIVFNVSMSTGSTGQSPLLKLFRVLRLSRIARMGKLLRQAPELLILIKGMVAALRSVFFTLLLLVILLYCFALFFRQTMGDNAVIGDLMFGSVTQTMQTLLTYGVIGDSLGVLDLHLREEGGVVMLFVFYFFILLGAWTVMNMLIGVLCEVVSAVAETENEGITLATARDEFEDILKIMDIDSQDAKIGKETFIRILQAEGTATLLESLEVKVLDLVDLVPTIFAAEHGMEQEEVNVRFGSKIFTGNQGDQREFLLDLKAQLKDKGVASQTLANMTIKLCQGTGNVTIADVAVAETSMLKEMIKTGALNVGRFTAELEEVVLDFQEMVTMCLEHRESKDATLKDTTTLRKYFRGRIEGVEDKLGTLTKLVDRLAQQPSTAYPSPASPLQCQPYSPSLSPSATDQAAQLSPGSVSSNSVDTSRGNAAPTSTSRTPAARKDIKWEVI